MDFSIRSLRTLKSDNNKKDSKSRAPGRDFQNQDRLAEVIKGVREAIQESRQNSLKIGEILKVMQKKRMINTDREELQAVLSHYAKLQIIMLDQEENVIFL